MSALPDNAAIAWLIAQRAPHLSPAQLAVAVRREDVRDTYGTRHALAMRAPLIGDVSAPVAGDPDRSPLLAVLLPALASAGLSALIAPLSEGLSMIQAAQAAGIPERTVFRKIAAIRANLAGFLAAN